MGEKQERQKEVVEMNKNLGEEEIKKVEQQFEKEEKTRSKIGNIVLIMSICSLLLSLIDLLIC